VHEGALHRAAELSAAKATTVGTALGATKLFVVVAAGITGAAVAHFARGPVDHRGATPDRSTMHVVAAMPAAPMSLPSVDDPVAPPAPPRARPSHGGRVKQRGSGTVTGEPSTLARETALGEGARAVLEVDPARALALTSEYEREFPNGQLRGALALIRVEALARLERPREAEEEARRRLETGGRDIYSDRMRRVLGADR
jgi:hypothetical protein